MTVFERFQEQGIWPQPGDVLIPHKSHIKEITVLCVHNGYLYDKGSVSIACCDPWCKLEDAVKYEYKSFAPVALPKVESPQVKNRRRRY